MDTVHVLDRLSSLGVAVEVAGDKLRLMPGSKVPTDLAEAVRQHKGDIIRLLQTHDGPIPTMSALDFPQGYRGLPQEPVALGLQVADALGWENPVLVKHNVLCFVVSWLLDHYQNTTTGAFDDPEIARLYDAVKAERARLAATYTREQSNGRPAQ